jgi:hypothetical protein
MIIFSPSWPEINGLLWSHAKINDSKSNRKTIQYFKICGISASSYLQYSIEFPQRWPQNLLRGFSLKHFVTFESADSQSWNGYWELMYCFSWIFASIALETIYFSRTTFNVDYVTIWFIPIWWKHWIIQQSLHFRSFSVLASSNHCCPAQSDFSVPMKDTKNMHSANARIFLVLNSYGCVCLALNAMQLLVHDEWWIWVMPSIIEID